MNAMTWYDHETHSGWSQPIGMAMVGEYKGVRLDIIPASVVPWDTWKHEHPNTLVLTTDYPFKGGDYNPFNPLYGDQVIGVALGDLAKAYPFWVVAREVVVNDRIGDIPVVVYVNPESKSAHVYLRVLDDVELEFEWADGKLKDRQTGTLWDPTKGFGEEGPLKRKLLREIPYSTAYDWAWEDFYPATEVYKP